LQTAARWFDLSGARAGTRRSPARSRRTVTASGSETEESEVEPAPVDARKVSAKMTCYFCDGAHRIEACPQLAHLCSACGEPKHEGGLGTIKCEKRKACVGQSWTLVGIDAGKKAEECVLYARLRGEWSQGIVRYQSRPLGDLRFEEETETAIKTWKDKNDPTSSSSSQAQCSA
jgi:hypothetical protein